MCTMKPLAASIAVLSYILLLLLSPTSEPSADAVETCQCSVQQTNKGRHPTIEGQEAEVCVLKGLPRGWLGA